MNISQLKEADRIIEECVKRSEQIANECMELLDDPNNRHCKAALKLCRKLRRLGSLSARVGKENNDDR